MCLCRNIMNRAEWEAQARAGAEESGWLTAMGPGCGGGSGQPPALGPHDLSGFTGAAASGGWELCDQLPAGGPCPTGSWECPTALPPSGEI